MLTKAKKEDIAKKLSGRFGRAKIAIFSDFRGVSVAKLQALRRLLKQTGAEYSVSKKTLFDRALAGAGVDLSTKKFEGELGVAFGYEDEISPAKTLFKFSRENDTFKILGAILGGKILQEKEAVALAKLPSREVLIAQVVGALSSPLRELVGVLRGNMRNFVVVLNKINEQKA